MPHNPALLTSDPTIHDLIDEVPAEPYLKPYLRAVEQHGAGFRSLLWASPRTQADRFEAMTRLYEFTGRNVLDAGSGRADFLDYLLSHKITPAHYVGLEAVPALAAAARAKSHRNAIIIQADFVRDPSRLLVGADVVVFSGSLNTLDAETFYATIRTAYNAAAEAVVLNFLSSPDLAAAQWLTWHHTKEVMTFAQSLSPKSQSSKTTSKAIRHWQSTNPSKRPPRSPFLLLPSSFKLLSSSP